MSILVLCCLFLLVMFQVYDLNGDGLIVREEMFSLLKENQVMQQASPSDDDPEEGVKDLVETVLKKLVRLFRVSCNQ